MLTDSNDPRPIHFVGIAGAGMRALAELFARRGAKITGCDNNLDDAAILEAKGITVLGRHDASHSDGIRAMVTSSAIRQQLPEILRAREKGIPVIRRAEALSEAVAGAEVIGVAGTHGKTTTTVMTTEALRAAGLNPTGIAGGTVGAWNGNLSDGSDNVFVVESDEYDRSFLALAPTVAVVTNVEADHLDIYADLADIQSAFSDFIFRAKAIVLCSDDPGANSLKTPGSAEVIRYGIESPDARLVAHSIETGGGKSSFVVRYDGKNVSRIEIPVPGLHNIRNALAALGAGIALGVKVEQMAPGLIRFTRVERRFQILGDFGGVTIIDDYAHHPTEIAATLEAARSTFRNKRIIAAFQPHLYSRTRDFYLEFARVLAFADKVFLVDLYPARETPIDGVSSALIADAMHNAGAAPGWQGSRDALARAIAAEARSGDVVILLGAGDITRTGSELAELLSLDE